MSDAPEVHLVAAARPNLPKLAALWHALAARRPAPPLRPVLVHTGQHADARMFGDHLADLGLPAPEVSLGVSGGTHAALTGRTMLACESLWLARPPALVVVPGDVDGALAACLAARKIGVPVAHLEAGLRCGEADMPEEVNRRAMDAVSTLLWAPDEATASRLLREGHAPGAVRAVGNAMADSLLRALPEARARALPAGLKAGLEAGRYGVLTLHRPANVDARDALAAALRGVARAAARLPLAWPVHPRTAARLATHGLEVPPGVRALPPLGYLDMLALLSRAALVATDSGGVQEEAAVLGVPCLTLRPSTERPATVEAGGNRLVPDPADLAAAVGDVLARRWPAPGAPRPVPLWDGRAGARMVEHLAEWLAAARPGLAARGEALAA